MWEPTPRTETETETASGLLLHIIYNMALEDVQAPDTQAEAEAEMPTEIVEEEEDLRGAHGAKTTGTDATDKAVDDRTRRRAETADAVPTQTAGLGTAEKDQLEKNMQAAEETPGGISLSMCRGGDSWRIYRGVLLQTSALEKQEAEAGQEQLQQLAAANELLQQERGKSQALEEENKALRGQLATVLAYLDEVMPMEQE